MKTPPPIFLALAAIAALPAGQDLPALPAAAYDAGAFVELHTANDLRALSAGPARTIDAPGAVVLRYDLRTLPRGVSSRDLVVFRDGAPFSGSATLDTFHSTLAIEVDGGGIYQVGLPVSVADVAGDWVLDGGDTVTLEQRGVNVRCEVRGVVLVGSVFRGELRLDGADERDGSWLELRLRVDDDRAKGELVRSTPRWLGSSKHVERVELRRAQP